PITKSRSFSPPPICPGIRGRPPSYLARPTLMDGQGPSRAGEPLALAGIAFRLPYFCLGLRAAKPGCFACSACPSAQGRARGVALAESGGKGCGPPPFPLDRRAGGPDGIVE